MKKDKKTSQDIKTRYDSTSITLLNLQIKKPWIEPKNKAIIKEKKLVNDLEVFK